MYKEKLFGVEFKSEILIMNLIVILILKKKLWKVYGKN